MGGALGIQSSEAGAPRRRSLRWVEPGTSTGLRRKDPEVGGAQSRRSLEAESRGGGWGYSVTQMPTLAGGTCVPFPSVRRAAGSHTRALFFFFFFPFVNPPLQGCCRGANRNVQSGGVAFPQRGHRCLNFLRKAKVYSH